MNLFGNLYLRRFYVLFFGTLLVCGVSQSSLAADTTDNLSITKFTSVKECKTHLVQAAKNHIRENEPLRRRAYFFLKKTAKKAANEFLSAHPNPAELTEMDLLRFQELLEHRLQTEWQSLKLIPRKALVIGTYFTAIGGVPALVTYLTKMAELPDAVVTSSPVVSGLLAAYIFNPFAECFLPPIAAKIKQLGMRMWGEQDDWHQTYSRFTYLERDIASQINNVILTLRDPFEAGQRAILNGDRESAVRHIGDGIMRYWELYGGISPENITLVRHAELTLIESTITAPTEHDAVRHPSYYKQLSEDVLTYIFEFYRTHEHRLPDNMRAVSRKEREAFFRQVTQWWLDPTRVYNSKKLIVEPKAKAAAAPTQIKKSS